jgi:hypothetical protein
MSGEWRAADAEAVRAAINTPDATPQRDALEQIIWDEEQGYRPDGADDAKLRIQAQARDAALARSYGS